MHHFAQRSAAADHMETILAAAAEAEFLVLNGDVFDFKWTVLPTVAETVDAAVQWLRDLAGAHPHCRFVYVLGNHDDFQPFVQRLDELAAETHNLEWRASHHRTGTALFLHGDLPAARRRGRKAFTRSFHTSVRRRGKFLSLCYDVLVAAGMHRWLTRLDRPRRLARRILRALEADETGLAEGLTDVYFGHTHGAFSDFRYGGLTFHNTGSAIRGLRCNVLTVRTAPPIEAAPTAEDAA